MQIWFFAPFGALALRYRRIVVHDLPERPDLESARERARKHLSPKLSPRMLKDIGLGDD
jgi:hypothetical protein